MNVAYQNSSDMDSKPLTGCIKHGIFALFLTEITLNSSVITYSFISKDTREKLTLQFHILSLQFLDQRKSVPQHL